MPRFCFILVAITFLFSFANLNYAQSYTSYFIGDSTNSVNEPLGGVCLMGGAGENDAAVQWFLNQANGGDILVLRASGSDGYNDYFYSELGVTVNSVETIVFNDATAAYDSYVLNKITHAEAIWFAGGNQWDYVSYWRNTPVDSIINSNITAHNLVIGGTSAGMAILGSYYFSAEFGTITSTAALTNPYNTNITVDSNAFLNVPYLYNVITDTHYDDPDRKGRHFTFLARISNDYGTPAFGIACDEYTAVCINLDGIANVYGGFPTYDDNAYFIQTNCEIADNLPEVCEVGSPLSWNKDGKAIRSYHIKGTPAGEGYFNLTNWTEGSGGDWQFWYVEDGEFIETIGTAPDCDLSNSMNPTNSFTTYPNPAQNEFTITALNPINRVTIYNLNGELVYKTIVESTTKCIVLHPKLAPGTYYIQLETVNGLRQQSLIITQ